MKWKVPFVLLVAFVLLSYGRSWSGEETGKTTEQTSPNRTPDKYLLSPDHDERLYNLMLTQADPFDSANDPFHRRGKRPGGPGPGFGEERQKHLEQFRTLKLIELLDLQEDQEIEFLTSFRAIRNEHKALDEEKQQLLEKLSEDLAAGNVDGARMDAALDEYFRIEQKRRDTHIKFLDKMKKTLSPEQLGKFLLFQERFERELIKKVMEFDGRFRPGR